MPTQRSGIVGRLTRAGLLGGVAGAAVLALDLALLRGAQGYWIGVDTGAVSAYLVAGALLAAITQTTRLAFGAPEGAAGTTLALAAALFYLPAIVERADHVLAAAAVPGSAVAAFVLGAGAYLGWLGLLRRLSGSPVWAWTLGALSAALALAANRNLAAGAFSPAALVLDGAVAAAVLALALAARLRGGARVAASAVAVAGLTVVVGFVPRETIPEPPGAGDNLVLVVIDTLRLDVFEDVVARTPEGARFARAMAGATWFDNAIAIAPWTVPSMGSILTGLYPSEHGLDLPGGFGTAIPPLAPQSETLAQRLQGQGYHCEGLVTSPYLRPGTGLERGFDHYELLEGAAERLPLLAAMTRVGLLGAQAYQPAASVRRRLAQRLADLEGRRSRLFFFLHLLDPHVPLHPHPELAAEAAGPILSGEESLYRQEVRYALDELAGMLEMLAKRGLLEHSVVAVTADHGELFASDERSGRRPSDGATLRLEGHGSALYEELLRVPLVVRPPAGRQDRPARHTQALASHVDLVPTFLDLLGLPARPEVERFSLASAIAGAPETADERASATSGVNVAGRNPAIPAQLALRNRRYWLIHYPAGELRDELYDLSTDPGERRNRAVEQPELLTALRRELELTRPWLTPALAEPAPSALDETTRRRLRALGYL